MTTHIHSKATVFGQPIHPMLVGIPVVLYIATVVLFVGFATNHDPAWLRAGLFMNAAGVIGALLAAIPGFVDWAFAIPRESPAKRTGAFHMALNVSALACFAANLGVHRNVLIAACVGNTAKFATLDPVWLLVPTGVGIAATVCAGALGWMLVNRHHVGDEPTPAAMPKNRPPTPRPLTH